MPIISKLKYSFILFSMIACQSRNEQVTINNKHLSLVNDVMLYKEKSFSGTLVSKIDTLTTYKATYLNGKKHGEEQKFFFNGKLSEYKLYTRGIKTGTHRAWWNNEQLMSEYHYDDQGNYVGTQREWSSSGQLIKELNYAQGEENGPQKKWDYTGKIIANYQVINGEVFGLIGAEKCKPDNYVD